ncbi:AaceriAGL246Wp [[Ashbya] aceris (nom. inval.)]|nr:AaceriAGL246Wp [[Ashbya] aceris (nom. inval.)]
MSEDRLFFERAAEAIMQTSINRDKVDPTIRELLNRIKYTNPDKKGTGGFTRQSDATVGYAEARDRSAGLPTLVGSEKSSVLNYFDKLLTAGRPPSAPGSARPERAREASLAYLSEDELLTKKRKASPGVALETSGGPEETAHDGKRFHCSKCELVFRRSGDLRRHEKVHLPILPNICSLCGKGFARKDALKRHFGTLTCKRNRQKLLSIGGDINEILEKARQNGAKV